MANGLERKPGGSSLVQDAMPGAAAGVPGKRTLAEQLAPVQAKGAGAGAGTGGAGGAGAATTTYTVQAGENLQAIAAKLHTTVEALKAANAGKLKSFPTRSGAAVQGFNAGEVIDAPGAAAGTGATAGATGAGTEAEAEAEEKHEESGGGGDLLNGLIGAASGALHALEHLLPSWAGGGASSPATGAQPGGGGATAATETGTEAGAQAGTAPLADLTDAQRGEQLSTFTAGEAAKTDKFGMSKTGRAAAQKRDAWLSASDISAAGRGKSGTAYVESVDELVGNTELTGDQGKVVTAAKEFAAAPKALTPEQEQKAVVDWGSAQLLLDGVSLNGDLKARIIRYVRFLAWAGLVTGPTKVGSVMRSPKTAHKLSVAWMFNLGSNTSGGSTLHKPELRQKLVSTVTDKGGSDVDGNTWLGPATVEGLKAKKDDDPALFEYIKTTAAPEANKVQKQGAIAAEGYRTPDKRHPNVLPGSGVSNHLLGEAVDMTPPFVLNNKFDPIIDAIAMYFGLWRAVKDSATSPEHWHYERLGMPPGAESDDAAGH